MNSFALDFDFGKIALAEASTEDDLLHGVDLWIGTLPVAHRRRRFAIGRFHDIAIRYSRDTGSKTEFEKLIDGSSKALAYLYQFDDCWVLLKTADIVGCLLLGRYEVREGDNGQMACIDVGSIPHLIIWNKGGTT